MTKSRITILSLLLAIMLCMSGLSFAAAFAAEEETVLLNRDGTLSAITQDYQAKLQISPWNDGSYSYQMRATQIEIVFRDPLDASWAQTSEHQVVDNVYLDFWIFSNRPQSEAAWSGDNQIEIASDQSGHDYNEYHWSFSDVVWQQGATGQNAYIPGKWNHARLLLSNNDSCHVGEVDLSRITYFRMYYLFNTNDFGPVFISDVRLVKGEAGQDVIGDDYRDAPKVVFPETVAMPAGKTEGESAQIPYPEILDLNGSPVASTNIRIATTGPNGFVMEGAQILLEDGYGTYTTTYTVTNLMGVSESHSYTFEVAAADADRWAPRVLVSDEMPADFIVLDEDKGDVPHNLEDFITITDNRGYAALEVSATIVDEAGRELNSYSKAAGEDIPFALEFAPDSNETYTLKVFAEDAAGLTVESEIALPTYMHAREDIEVKLFDEQTGSLEFLTGGYYSGRLVDAHPQDGSGKSIAFHYEGGATDTTNNELARQEMILMNNLPADVSEIDMRWAAIRLNIYIDRTYAQDSVFMSSDGKGYGNMGLGFSSYSGIYNVPRMEYAVMDLGLKPGWNEVTIKLGRTFNGTVDPEALCEIYLYSNFGSERHFLINDVRMVEAESDKLTEGSLTATDTVSYIETRYLHALPDGASATAELDDSGIYKWRDSYPVGNEITFPALRVVDYLGNVDIVGSPNVSITDPTGIVTTSMYFTPVVQGEHTIVYSATDWYGKAVSLTKTFTVGAPNSLPVIRLETEENAFGELVPVTYRCRVGNSFVIPDIKAVDPEGEKVTVTFRVTAPNGAAVELSEENSFTAALPGDYTILVIAEDEIGQIVVEEVTLESYDITESVYKPTPVLNLGIFFGCLGGGVALAAVVAVVVVVMVKKKKRKAAAEPDSDQNTED